MERKEDVFLATLLTTFKAEAQEHVSAITLGLLALEKAEPTVNIQVVFEQIVQETHSLKGAARAVNKIEVEAICQSLESIFVSLKKQGSAIPAEHYDVLHQAIDLITDIVNLPKDEVISKESTYGVIKKLNNIVSDPRQASVKHEATAPVVKRNQVVAPEIPQKKAVIQENTAVVSKETKKEIFQQTPVVEPATTSGESIRIATTKLDALLLQAEETLAIKLATKQRHNELQEIKQLLSQWKESKEKITMQLQLFNTANPVLETHKIKDTLNKLIEVSESSQAILKSVEGKLNCLTKEVSQDYLNFGSLLNNLLEDTKKLLMLPFSMIFNVFPKIVRDLGRQQNKQVEIIIHGETVEIDKRMLDEMKDPFLHLLRNAIDHGIETPEVRIQNNKNVKGTITINIEQLRSNEVAIEFSDDGKGIDLKAVKQAAIEQGQITVDEAEKLEDQDCLDMIFFSGLSTSQQITEISGRGLGMAIIREKIRKLGGQIEITTKNNAGTKIKIVLPLTLATFKGMVVRVSEHLFVIPLANVERTVRVNMKEPHKVGNKQTININDQVVSLISLNELLGLEKRAAQTDATEHLTVVVVANSKQQVAFVVDEVLYEQEVLTKGLGKPISRINNISGATVLGSGQAVPVLNINDLINSSMRNGKIATATSFQQTETTVDDRGKILLVEDSITTRMLLKNILELAGYDVTTAVDGMEAWDILNKQEVGLVISDVDMPRMNGFDLTRKIRNDDGFTKLPVILVTGKETPEDRQTGFTVGANAYILKSNFHNSNLLEFVERLI
jgi:two-component system chemotaxis sensor kinase CheA